jgi:hypothetical protein
MILRDRKMLIVMVNHSWKNTGILEVIRSQFINEEARIHILTQHPHFPLIYEENQLHSLKTLHPISSMLS